MAIEKISDLRLVTLLPTSNQTIYAFNTNNPREFYTESFFARMGTTWAFCVIPDRSDTSKDHYINIIQTDNQTITLSAIIPEVATNTELRAGILNYYSGNLGNKYTYTIGYQDIRIFATAVSRSTLNVDYKTITINQTENQIILVVDETDMVYAYTVDLPYNTYFKVALISTPEYNPGEIHVTDTDTGKIIQSINKPDKKDSDEEEYNPDDPITPSSTDDLEEDIPLFENYVTRNYTITATEAQDRYTYGTMKPGLFDNSTTDLSNSDGYIRIGIGTEVSKQVQLILLYNQNKIQGESVQLGTTKNKLLYAPLGSKSDDKATRMIYKTNTQHKYVLRAVPGYYGYDYIIGYLPAISGSTMNPLMFTSKYTGITVRGFGFAADKAPVNDSSTCHYFVVIDPPPNDNWSYFKLMIFDNTKRVFSMIAPKRDFKEITSGQFIGQYIFSHDSKYGVSDEAALYLKNNIGKSITIAGFVL